MARQRRTPTQSNRRDGEDEPSTRLVHARRAAGYATAESAAKAMDIPLSTYSQHECGVRGIKFAVDRYAEAFGVSRDWLMHGEAGPPVPRKVVQSQGDNVIMAPGVSLADLRARENGDVADPGRLGPDGDVSIWVEHIPAGIGDNPAVPFAAAFLERLGLTVQSAALLQVGPDAEGSEMREGDMVLIDTDDTEPDYPGVFAMGSPTGPPTVRKLVPLTGTEPLEVRITIEGDEPYSYNAKAQSLKIHGRVRWIGRVI